MTRIFLFLAISFSPLATHRATAAGPPIAILAAWIDRDSEGKLILVIKVQEHAAILDCDFSSRWYDKNGEEITDDEKRLRDQSGKRIPVSIPTKPAIIGYGRSFALAKDAIYTETFPFQRRAHLPENRTTFRHVALMKFSVVAVRLADKTIWIPPANQPITFEARLLEKQEKTGKQKAK